MFTEGKHYAVDEAGCWLWLRATNGHGYGVISIKDKLYTAHRVSYENTYGPITEGMYILHNCDVKRCIKPTHLREGTHRDNMDDATQRGLMSGNGRPLTDDDIALIELFHSKGYNQTKISKLTGISRPAVKAYLKQLHNN